MTLMEFIELHPELDIEIDGVFFGMYAEDPHVDLYDMSQTGSPIEDMEEDEWMNLWNAHVDYETRR